MTSDSFFLFILTCLIDFSLIFYFISFIIIKKTIFPAAESKKTQLQTHKVKMRPATGRQNRISPVPVTGSLLMTCRSQNSAAAFSMCLLV